MSKNNKMLCESKDEGDCCKVKLALLNKSNVQVTGGSERYGRFNIGSSW